MSIPEPLSLPFPCVGVRRRLHMEGPPSTELPAMRCVPVPTEAASAVAATPLPTDPVTHGGDAVDVTSIDVEDLSRPISVQGHCNHDGSPASFVAPAEEFPLPTAQDVVRMLGTSFHESGAVAPTTDAPWQSHRPQLVDTRREPRSEDASFFGSRRPAAADNPCYNDRRPAPMPLQRLPSGTISPPRVKPKATKPLVKKPPPVRPSSPSLSRMASTMSSRSPPGVGNVKSENNSSLERCSSGPTLSTIVVRSPASRPAALDASPSPRVVQGIPLPRSVDRYPVQDAPREDQLTHDAFQRRGDVRTPLLRHRLVQTDDVRFYGVGLRSPPRPSLSSQSEPQLISIGKASDNVVNTAEKSVAALLKEPILCSAWTTTKSSTFINNF